MSASKNLKRVWVQLMANGELWVQADADGLGLDEYIREDVVKQLVDDAFKRGLSQGSRNVLPCSNVKMET